MKITQIRNATILVEIGAYRILVDPMLAAKDALPPLKIAGHRQRNPIVDLPAGTDSLLETVTHCLITHCQKGHFDHLDRAGKRWLRSKQIPVICTPHDANYLQGLGLNVCALPAEHHMPQPVLGGKIRTVACTHGRGLIGLLMEHGVGYFIEMPGEPGLYLAGDTIFTSPIGEFIAAHRPDVSVIPAGGARFDVGHEVIMGESDAVAFTLAHHGIVIANHLEALSHCPVSRSNLAASAEDAGIKSRLWIPADGVTLTMTT